MTPPMLTPAVWHYGAQAMACLHGIGSISLTSIAYKPLARKPYLVVYFFVVWYDASTAIYLCIYPIISIYRISPGLWVSSGSPTPPTKLELSRLKF
ncbi:hypothetical protein BZA77DRAFT_138851 [Pyronema omphalodes]|nr:hypothetical protein BZA77DRAFT_138851 [Pyronema omphalodes]